MKVDFAVTVPAAAAGNKAARDELMAAFYAWSVTQAGMVLSDTEQARDVAVDFWTWLFTDNGIQDYDPKRSSFYTWMAMQLKYRARTAASRRPSASVVYQAEVNDPRSFDPDPNSGIIAEAALKEIAQNLPSDTHRDVLRLMMAGNSIGEIARLGQFSEKRAANLVGEIRAEIVKTFSDC